MNNASENNIENNDHEAGDNMIHLIEEKQIRKIRARNSKDQSIWVGLGMMGTIGWAVTVPTLLGVIIGIWIDTRWPGSFSWTLTLMFGGLLLGCVSAWLWVSREQENIEREKEERKLDHYD